MIVSLSRIVRWTVAVVAGLGLAIAPTVQAAFSTNTATAFTVGTAPTDAATNITAFFIGAQDTFWSGGTTFLVGSAATPAAGGTNNTVSISNAFMRASADWFVGSVTSNNTVNFLANTVVDMAGRKFVVGFTSNSSGAVSSNNQVILNGAVLTNGYIYIGTNTSNPAVTTRSLNNSLIASNGSLVVATGLSVGSFVATSAGNVQKGNYAYISNITVAAALGVSTGNIMIGEEGGKSNTAILANVMWDGKNSGTLSVGLGRGNTDSSTNALFIQDGSQVTNFPNIWVGREMEGNNSTNRENLLVVQGQGTRLTASGAVWVGLTDQNSGTAPANPAGATSNNVMKVLSGATVLSTNLYVGVDNINGNAQDGQLSYGNQVLLSGGIWTNSGDVVVGLASRTAGSAASTQSVSNNALIVADGSTFWTTNLVVGAAVNTVAATTVHSGNNQLIISNGGSVVTKDLTLGRNLGVGTAFLNGNQVLVTNGNLTVTGRLLIGDGAGGTATGNRVVIGGTSTAVVQQLIIRNSNTLTFLGGDLTVSTLLSNGSGGALIVGDGTQAARLSLTGNHQHFLTTGLAIATNATLRGNGTILGDVASSGTISPGLTGFPIDTLAITGRLTLASSAITVMELSNPGVSDLLDVGGLFTYDGKLVVTNITGFAFAAGQTFNLFDFGSQTGNFASFDLQDLSALGLAWDTSQLNALGQLAIVVPEPSTLALLGGSVLALLLLRRRDRRFDLNPR